MVKYLVDQNGAPTGNLGESINIESDCEGDAQGLSEEARRAREGKGEQFRAVFIIGSFSAYATLYLAFFPLKENDGLSSWKSLFFYRCTDKILFAPLKSQGVYGVHGVHYRSQYIREKTTAAVPPPCSPKSIYVLASLVRLPSTKRVIHGTDVSILARNQAPLRNCRSRYQWQNVPRRFFLVGQFRVRPASEFRTGCHANAVVQSAEDREDGKRIFHPKPQRPEVYRFCER